MAKSSRRLILGNGEAYIEPLRKATSGRSPPPPRSYEAARAALSDNLTTALESFSALPSISRRSDEATFCLRMHPDATAKSYDPDALFVDAPQLKKVGSRSYRDQATNVTKTDHIAKLIEQQKFMVDGRLVFVQSSVAGFREFLKQLERPESVVPKTVQDELQRIERIDQLTPFERVLGFENWDGGRVELVFHPSRVLPGQQLEFIFDLFENLGVDDARRTVRPYAGGPTFVSCFLSPDELNVLSSVNPLRAAHPLVFGGLEDLRAAPAAPAPKPPASGTKSTIKVGMFDGGVDTTLPHLQGYVEEDSALSIKTTPDATCIAHGTAVAGAILYGPLNGLPASLRLPTPPVSVVSFRCLPTSDPVDTDLYECIDVIEDVVPTRKDIKAYNLSFGPRGPILDDTISRFTYALDTLAVSQKVSFFIAVGNDGAVDGWDRIQAPADVVHGIGVGAYTDGRDGPEVASYSCRGPGRECGKIKPDIAAFGGCENTPLHLLSSVPGQKILTWGTSFASPFAARLGARAADAFDRSSTLLARALIVHCAHHPNRKPDFKLGHGCIPDDLDDVLTCDPQAVTIVFQKAIRPKQTVKLPIPLPHSSKVKGAVQIRWTVVGIPPVNPSHPSDYTSSCLEDTFYPHVDRYSFTNKEPRGRKVLDLIQQADEAHSLLAMGWKKAGLPESDSGNKYTHESTKRAIDCKWEPLVRREISKQAGGLKSPFLTLQAIGRNDAVEPFDYVVIVTVKALDYEGDIYSDVRTLNPALLPIRVKTEAELRVQM